MGLFIKAGILAWQKRNIGIEDEAVEVFEELYKVLAKNGFSEFRENEDCLDLGYSMYGYSGLHYLRRIAAHLSLSTSEPAPGLTDGIEPPNDPLLKKYYELADSKSANLDLRFKHLIDHSDCDGFYVPIDFDNILFEPQTECKQIGSSYRLLEDCLYLAKFLELPLTIDPDGKELFDSLENQGIGEKRWQRYAVESFTCLRLLKVAEHSIETGTAVIFC